MSSEKEGKQEKQRGIIVPMMVRVSLHYNPTENAILPAFVSLPSIPFFTFSVYKLFKLQFKQLEILQLVQSSEINTELMAILLVPVLL